jgi:ADP-heptose:LPS heptosyltransferase
MQIQTMRLIDKYLGIPLCFLTSVFIRFFSLFSARKKINLKRCLFIELSEMGSAILADPAIRYLQEKASSDLYFLIFQQNAESLELLQTIPSSQRFTIRSNNMLVLTFDVVRFVFWCRKNKLTTVIDLELYSRFTSLLCVFSGCRHRIGFDSHHDEGFYRGKLINYPVRYNSHVHISVNFMALVHRALAYFSTPYAKVLIKKEDIVLQQAHYPPAVYDKVKTTLSTLDQTWESKRLIIFNINASDMLPQRKWRLEHFVTTARLLIENLQDILIVATGSKSERSYVQHFVDRVGASHCLNAAALFSLQEMVALCSLSACMLSNDSGPAHFASTTALKIFVIFGPESPDLYLPLGNSEAFYLQLACSPCVSAANHRKTDCSTQDCVENIQAEKVAERMIEFLTYSYKK